MFVKIVALFHKFERKIYLQKEKAITAFFFLISFLFRNASESAGVLVFFMLGLGITAFFPVTLDVVLIVKGFES